MARLRVGQFDRFVSGSLLKSRCWTSLLEVVCSPHGSPTALPVPSQQFLYVCPSVLIVAPETRDLLSINAQCLKFVRLVPDGPGVAGCHYRPAQSAGLQHTDFPLLSQGKFAKISVSNMWLIHTAVVIGCVLLFSDIPRSGLVAVGNRSLGCQNPSGFF